MRYLQHFIRSSAFLLLAAFSLGMMMQLLGGENGRARANNNEDVVALYAEQRDELLERPLKDVLQSAQRDLGQWFVQNQSADGHFHSAFLTSTGQPVGPYDDVFEVGAFYALAMSQRTLDSPEVQTALEAGLDYFEQYRRESTVAGKAVVFYESSISVQAVVTAFMFLARQEIAAVTGVEDPELRALADYVALSQLPDGSFDAYYLNSREIACGTSDDYHGVALTALAKAAKQYGDPTYLAAAQKAADYAIQSQPDIVHRPFFAYGMEGIATLYELTGDSGLKDYIVNQADLLIDFPYGPLTFFMKGQDNRPPVDLPWQYNEGVIAIYRVLKAEDEPQVKQLELGLSRALALSAAFQVPDADLHQQAMADNVLGGACEDTRCLVTRLNVSAVFLRSLAAAEQILPATVLSSQIGDLQ